MEIAETHFPISFCRGHSWGEVINKEEKKMKCDMMMRVEKSQWIGGPTFHGTRERYHAPLHLSFSKKRKRKAIFFFLLSDASLWLDDIEMGNWNQMLAWII